ncbi:MAG: sugar transporter permease [Bacilli bacterium]|nr:sugar transporter permease [Bacilli bacterium]
MEVQLTPRIVKPGLLRKMRWYYLGLLFLIPEIVIFFIFLWLPIFKGIRYSFFYINFVDKDAFVGLQNYIDVISNENFVKAITNTLQYMSLTVVLGFWVPIVMAICVSELKWFQGPARVIGYLPSIIPAIVLYGMWLWFYDTAGPINSFLKSLGISGIDFFSKKMSMVSLVFLDTWQNFGSATLIYIAGLTTIPKDLYEAAELDGAGVWNRIRYITLPSIKNLILLLLLLQLIATSQSFQPQLVMFGGGPDNATLTYLLMTTRMAFNDADFGKASAMGSMMFIVLVLVSLITIKFRRGEAS